MFYYGSGNPAPWNETMRPGDNKWTMTIWGRDANTGLAKFGYQKTPHDEWDYAGVNVIMLSDQQVNGKTTPLKGLHSYDPEKEPFFIRSVDPTWPIEPLRKHKLKPVWLGFPNSGNISGEFGNTPTQ